MPITKVKGQSKNGQQKYRVRVNYTLDGKNKQIERTAYGLSEARLVEMQLLGQIGKETENDITVNELYLMYCNEKQYEIRETSLNKSKRNIENHILPLLGTQKLSQLTVARLSQWKTDIASKGNSVRTNKNIYSELHALLTYAYKKELIKENTLNKVGNFKDAYETNVQETLRYYTANQFRTYITCAEESAKTYIDKACVVFFYIAFFGGLRKGEINALKWTDIEKNKIHVRRSIAQKLKGGDRETPPKNKSSYRTIQIPLQLQEILEKHKLLQKSLFDNYTENFRVCGGETPLRDTTIENHNKIYAEKTNLPKIRIHDFRHSHASLLANSGINIQEIARRLGHSNVKETWQTYSHMYPSEEERAIKVLEEIKFGDFSGIKKQKSRQINV